MPNVRIEQAAQEKTGLRYIAGLDEAGRGAIAGPVFAAAVILPLENQEVLAHLAPVNDSKMLTPASRESLFGLIMDFARSYGIGSSSAAEIDAVGIVAANRRAMRRALQQLEPAPQYLLLDGRVRLPTVNIAQESIIRGDRASLSIAAASILAKVSRDRAMIAFDAQFPVYGFGRHKGYCTRAHEAALLQHGPCPIHRFSFAPLRQSLL